LFLSPSSCSKSPPTPSFYQRGEQFPSKFLPCTPGYSLLFHNTPGWLLLLRNSPSSPCKGKLFCPTCRTSWGLFLNPLLLRSLFPLTGGQFSRKFFPCKGKLLYCSWGFSVSLSDQRKSSIAGQRELYLRIRHHC
jgi:hypothetical protein